jgi:hypothetical protein
MSLFSLIHNIINIYYFDFNDPLRGFFIVPAFEAATGRIKKTYFGHRNFQIQFRHNKFVDFYSAYLM